MRSKTKPVTAKPQRPAITSIRLREEDWALLEKLQKQTGIDSVTDLARMGLRALAAKEGVK